MSKSIEEALAECLERVEAGELSREEALNRYPDLRAELEPLLALTAEIGAMPKVGAPASLRGYKRPVFRAPARSEAWWRRLLPAGGRSLAWSTPLAQAAAVLVFLAVGAGTTVVAAASSLPDEPLYPVKLAVESAQLALAPSSADRADLEMRFAAKRLDEVEKAAQQGRGEAVAKGAELYAQKVDAAVKASQEAVSPADQQKVDTSIQQNEVALQQVLDKLEARSGAGSASAGNSAGHSQAAAAIERVLAASKERASAHEKDAGGADKPAAQAIATPTPTSLPSSSTTATPTAVPTPEPAKGNEPPGKAKGQTEQPGSTGPGNSEKHDQEPQGNKAQGLKNDANIQAGGQVTATPTATAQVALQPTSRGQDAESPRGNGQAKASSDDDRKSQGKGNGGVLENLLDRLGNLVRR